MDALAAGRLYERVITVAFYVLSETEGKIDNIDEREARRGIDVPNNIVGMLEIRLASVNLMQLDAGQVREPYEGRVFGCDRIFDDVGLAQRDFLNPARCPIRQILLKERFAGHSIGKSHQGKRAALDVPQYSWSDFQVVLDQLGLYDVTLGEKDFLQIR